MTIYQTKQCECGNVYPISWNECPRCQLIRMMLQQRHVIVQQFEHGDHNPIWNYNMFTHTSTCQICNRWKVGMP